MTVDCAALCLKSGNAIVLRGSSYAERSNAALAGLVREAVAEAGLPEGAVELLAGGGREELERAGDRGGAGRPDHPARRRGAEGGAEGGRDGAGDVRGGGQLPRLRPRGRRPRDGAADRLQREGRSGPGSATRPRRCWSTPRSPASSCPASSPTSTTPGSSWSATSATRAAAGAVAVGEATEADWDTEYLGLKMAVGVVDSLDEAIEHVNRHGTGHSEAIVTARRGGRDAFTDGVDAAAVYVNASTRFTDGFEFGMGAEIGNSTQKLHARGPIGLRELTTTKYVVHGRRPGPGVGTGSAAHRRPRRRLQPAAHRPSGARPGGAFAARARRGAAGADRRGAAQADRARAGAARCGWRWRGWRRPRTSCSSVSTLEVERDGPSYSYRTLEWLSEQRPGDEFVFLMGADVAARAGELEAARAGARAGAARGRRRGRGRRSTRPRRRSSGSVPPIAPKMVEMPELGVSSTRSGGGRGRAPAALPGPGPGARLIAERGLYASGWRHERRRRGRAGSRGARAGRLGRVDAADRRDRRRQEGRADRRARRSPTWSPTRTTW